MLHGGRLQNQVAKRDQMVPHGGQGWLNVEDGVTCSKNGSWFRGYQCLQNKRKRRDRAWNSRTKLPPRTKRRRKGNYAR